MSHFFSLTFAGDISWRNRKALKRNKIIQKCWRMLLLHNLVHFIELLVILNLTNQPTYNDSIKWNAKTNPSVHIVPNFTDPFKDLITF